MRPDARATAEAMAQVMRTTKSTAFAAGLNPAQWAALRYIAQAEPALCSVVAFARHHGTTKGTASQTIAALTRKGLLSRHPGDDRRAVRHALTEAGRDALTRDPLNDLAAALAELPEDTHRALDEVLTRTLHALLERRAK